MTEKFTAEEMLILEAEAAAAGMGVEEFIVDTVRGFLQEKQWAMQRHGRDGLRSLPDPDDDPDRPARQRRA